MQSRSGDYPIETRSGEVERLALQDSVFMEATRALLDAVGVQPGWRCLDLGCGPKGITHVLSQLVGPTGHVTGLDYQREFVEIASRERPANTAYTVGDAYSTGFADHSFDFVHMRFLAGTAGQPTRLAAEAARLVRPGGFIAAQEADFDTLRCFPPHPAWTELKDLFVRCFPEPGSEPIAHRMYRILMAAGIRDVSYRPVLLGVRAQDPWRDYLPATLESMRGTLTGRLGVDPGHLATLLADCRAHLAQTDTVFTPYTLVQVWGRKP